MFLNSLLPYGHLASGPWFRAKVIRGMEPDRPGVQRIGDNRSYYIHAFGCPSGNMLCTCMLLLRDMQSKLNQITLAASMETQPRRVSYGSGCSKPDTQRS